MAGLLGLLPTLGLLPAPAPPSPRLLRGSDGRSCWPALVTGLILPVSPAQDRFPRSPLLLHILHMHARARARMRTHVQSPPCTRMHTGSRAHAVARTRTRMRTHTHTPTCNPRPHTVPPHTRTRSCLLATPCRLASSLPCARRLLACEEAYTCTVSPHHLLAVSLPSPGRRGDTRTHCVSSPRHHRAREGLRENRASTAQRTRTCSCTCTHAQG